MTVPVFHLTMAECAPRVAARESIDAAIALGMVGGKRGRTRRGGSAASAAADTSSLTLEEAADSTPATRTGSTSNSSRGRRGSARAYNLIAATFWSSCCSRHLHWLRTPRF